MLHIPPTNLFLLAVKQDPYQKKAYLFRKILKNFLGGKKFRRMGQQAKKKKMAERVTGLGRRASEETVKWNQMTPLRFQTEGRHQTSLASLRGFVIHKN